MEPLMLGKRLNLPLTVQLLAFLIWQALLGITGAILAIPLTFLLKKCGKHYVNWNDVYMQTREVVESYQF